MLLTSVTSSSFNYLTSQSITQSFDTSVSSSYSIDDLSLMNLTTDSSAARANLSLSFNSEGTVATVAFPGLTGTGSLAGVLSDGNWETIIEQEGIAGLASSHVYQFFFLAGDANHDRAVSAADFNIFSTNNGQSGSFNYSQADFTYDTIVNSADYNLLAGNFGRQVPEPLTGSNALSTNATSNYEVNLTWTAPANGTPDGYRIWRSLDGVTYTFLNFVEGAGTLSYPDGTLADGVKRWYRVRPYTTANGNGTTTNESSSVTVMNAPSGLSVTAVSTGGTDLSWTNNSSTATGFKIERSLTPKTGYSEVTTTTTTATTYHDGTALEGTTYYYRVSAVNSVAESAPCNRVSATTAAVNAPSNVSIFSASATQMQVNWMDNSSVESSFTVRLTGGGQTHTFSNVASNTTGYLASGLTEGATYSATVQAVGAGASSVQTVASNSTFTWGTSKEVYYTNFDGTDAEWSPHPHVNDYPTFPGVDPQSTSQSLGLFGNASTTLTLQGLPPHTAVEVDYGLIYNAFSPPGGADSTPATFTVTSGTQSVQSFRMDVFPNSGLWTAFPGGTPTFGHQGSSLTMQFHVDGLESVNNEQWAMTFCQVTIKRSTVSVELSGPQESGPDYNATEGIAGDTAKFWVKRTEPLFGSLPVKLNDSTGTASEGTDYGTIDKQQTIPDSSTHKNFEISAINDSAIEAETETVFLTIKPDALYVVAEQNPPVQGNVHDDDFEITGAWVDFNSGGIKLDDSSGMYPGEDEWRDFSPMDLHDDKAYESKYGDSGHLGAPLVYGRSLPNGAKYITASTKFWIRGNPVGPVSVLADASGPGTADSSSTAQLGDPDLNNKRSVLALYDMNPHAGQAGTPIPDVIQNDLVVINWTIATATNSVGYGESKNHIYVTGGDPAPQFESVYDVACRNAVGKRPGNAGEVAEVRANHNREVITGVFSDFENPVPGVKNVKNLELTYWGTYPMPASFTVQALLFHRTGRCEAWADFLVHSLNTAGIEAGIVRTKGNAAADARLTLSVPLPPNSGASLNIVVKPATAGQGNQHPTNVFNGHAIAKIIDDDTGADYLSTLFDPSYGLAYPGATMLAAEQAWQDAALDGFCWSFPDGTFSESIPHVTGSDEADFF